MNNLINIGNIEVHTDDSGMYLLSDLHKASGYEERHSPKYFLKSVQAKEIIKELSEGGILPSRRVKNVGTFACKTLIYSYAMWVSAKFAVHVIQTYDNIVMVEHGKLEIAQKRLKRAIVKDQNCVSVVLGRSNNVNVHSAFEAMACLGLVEMETELKPTYKKRVTDTGYEYLSGISRHGSILVKPEKHHELIALVRGVMVYQSGALTC
jgi:KilA-N domain